MEDPRIHGWFLCWSKMSLGFTLLLSLESLGALSTPVQHCHLGLFLHRPVCFSCHPQEVTSWQRAKHFFKKRNKSWNTFNISLFFFFKVLLCSTFHGAQRGEGWHYYKNQNWTWYQCSFMLIHLIWWYGQKQNKQSKGMLTLEDYKVRRERHFSLPDNSFQKKWCTGAWGWHWAWIICGTNEHSSDQTM